MSSPYWVEQRSGLLVPEVEPFTSYPGNDAWLELEPGVTSPGADPAWAQIETVPDVGAIPGKTVTWPGGGTQPTTQNATSVFGVSSLLCAGSGSSLSTPDHADFTLGGGDFTIEGRFRINVVRKALYCKQNPDESDRAWELTMDKGTAGAPVLSFLYATGAGVNWDVEVDWAFTATQNVWYHIAVVRSGVNLRAFIDGAQLGATYNIGTAVIRDSAAPLRLLGDANAAGNDFSGYADELRISNVARWTGTSFTVPTAAYTRDANTMLLMHMDGPNGGTAYTDSSGAPGAAFDPGLDPAWLEVQR